MTAVSTRAAGLVAVELGDPPGEATAALLDAAERERAKRFLRPADRHLFVVAHTLKRLVLAAVAGASPTALSFRVDPFGKPHLPASAGLHFNLSHTAGMAVVAWSRSGALGVDVESLVRVPCEPGVAELVLSADERRRLARATDPAVTFLEYWTAKEAVMKGEGKGLSLDPAAIAVDSLPVRLDGGRWHLHRYRPSPRHLLALALSDAGPPPPCRRLGEGELWAWAAGGGEPEGEALAGYAASSPKDSVV